MAVLLYGVVIYWELGMEFSYVKVLLIILTSYMKELGTEFHMAVLVATFLKFATESRDWRQG